MVRSSAVPTASPTLPTCDARHTPAGFAYPAPGLEDFLAPEQLDPAITSSCHDSAALAAQRYGERLQAAFRDIWPRSGTAVLAAVERVSVATATPALVKFCFVGKEEAGAKSIACGEVIFSLSKESVELRLSGREAVTSAQTPVIHQGPRLVSLPINSR